jgi:hypothetical protein
MLGAYSAVHLVAALVGLAFLLNGFLLVQHGREDLTLLGVSLVLGVGLLFVAAFPGSFEVLAGLLGLEWKARAILVVSNLTLFVAVSYLLNRLGQLSDRISRLNEEVSLLRSELEAVEREDADRPAEREAGADD